MDGFPSILMHIKDSPASVTAALLGLGRASFLRSRHRDIKARVKQFVACEIGRGGWGLDSSNNGIGPGLRRPDICSLV
jgi:hypothetical protein